VTPKTADVLSFLINLGGAPELSGKLVISNTAMVFKTVEFKWEITFLCDVALSFCYIATFRGIFRTA
jgi:hypothetical protein